MTHAISPIHGMHALLPLPRTWLFGPGADAGAHRTMAASGAHVLIQDLEDFTPPALRPQARALAPTLYAQWRAAGARACVRINDLDGEGRDDLRAVMPARPDIVAYPKADGAAAMRTLDAALAEAEAACGWPLGSTGILPVCETARGVLEVPAMAAATRRVQAALLGAEDLAADLRAGRSREGTELAAARGHFLLACRAAGIEPIDAPWTFADADGAAQEARAVRRLGYRCKSLVRSDHVRPVLEALVPSEAELAAARRLVAAFEQARERGEDRALVDGQWAEVPTYRAALRLLADG